MKNILYLVFIFCAASLAISFAEECITIPYSSMRMLAESIIDPCSICQKKLQKQALTIIAKEMYSERKIIFNSSCRLVKDKNCLENELLFQSNYNQKCIINGVETYLPLIIFKFYTNKNHIIGITEKDYTNDEIINSLATLPTNQPVRAEVEVITYKYADFPSVMFIPQRNAIIIHCKILWLKKP